jgi:type IV pilus modification protein PilV
MRRRVSEEQGMNRIPSKSTRGFSLIEVLVAVVIMTIGLLALASLQLSLMRASGQTKAQSVAMGLAKETIEADRAFTDYTGYQNLDSGGPTNTTVGNITYTITKTVERYVFDNDATTPKFVKYAATKASIDTLTKDLTIDYVQGRDFKKETVKVTWPDASGNTTVGENTVTLDDAIDWLDPADTARLSKKSTATNFRTAEIIITDPSKEAGVIPIAIGDAKDTAATNPRPVVNSSGTETRFDILTYAALSGGTALAQSRVETNVVGCTCDTATKPASTVRGYRPTYFNGSRYTSPALTTYSPPAGQKSSAASNESPYCSDCCRDHHDPSIVVSAKKPLFDPWRAAHTHYYRDNANALQAVDSTHTAYAEACRLIRVDGIFRVAADFNDEYFNLLETKNDGSTTEFVPTDTAAAHYVAMVLAYLDKKVISTNDSSTNPAVSKYNQEVSDTDVATFEASNAINNPSTISINRSNDHKWLHSRGLYVDYLETEALAAINQAKTDCTTKSCTDDEKQVAVLSVLPFTSINVSELSVWTPAVNNSSYVSVTNGAFYSQVGTDPVRGKTVPQTANIPGGAQDATAFTNMRKSNSALAAILLPIDKDEDGLDNSTNNPTAAELDSDSQAFKIAAAGGGGGSAGTFQVKPSGYGTNDPTISGTKVSNCTSAKVGGNTVYTCSSNDIGAADTLALSGYNYQSANSSKVTGAVITCTKADGTLPLSYTVDNSDPKLYTCANYKLNSLTSSNGGAVVTTPFTVVNDGFLTEKTSVLITPIAQGDVLTAVFGADTTKYGYSCIYTASLSDKVLVAATCK